MAEEFDRSDVAIDEHNQYESEMKFALSTKLMEDWNEAVENQGSGKVQR